MFVLKRIAGGLLVILASSVVAFGLMIMIPGDPAVTIAGENPTPERVAEISEQLGLDEPLYQQYGSWLSSAARLDLGDSLYSSQSVSEAIAGRLPITISLTVVTILLAFVMGITAGTVAALRPGGWVDRAATTAASLGVAIPHFWLGLALVTVFAISNRWFPATGYVALTDDPVDWLRHLALPSLGLAAGSAAELARQSRASLIKVLQEDYIRTAYAKGLDAWVVIVKHAGKNAAITVATVLGLQVSRLIGGAVVIEQAFALPGIGALAYTSVLNRDMPMVQGIIVVSAAIVVAVNFFVDLSYGYLNPRIRRPAG